MVIADCLIGSDVRLTDSDFDDATRFRLRELGLGRGTRARIVQRAPFGGRVLSVAGQRIAVDRDTTRRLAVEFATEPVSSPGRTR